MRAIELVTYCGLYCGLCSARARIPRRASELRDVMVKEGYELFGPGIPGFNEFWRFLRGLADPETSCPGCRQGGGPPFCSIRKCARARGVDICVECGEYPCKRVLSIAKGYPTLLADGQRMGEIGVESWVAEQKERAKTGFAYVDIRCHPYEVPDE
jgi:hypothetical protein